MQSYVDAMTAGKALRHPIAHRLLNSIVKFRTGQNPLRYSSKCYANQLL